MPLESLSKKHLAELVNRVVVEKLDASGSLRLFKSRPFGTNPLGFGSRDSLLLEFPGLKRRSEYRMLVSFRNLDLLDLSVQRKIERSLELLSAKIGVFWITEALTSIQVQALKRNQIDPLHVALADAGRDRSHRITDFIHIPEIPYDVVLQLNLVGNEIVRRLRKKFHLVLSEVAAESYGSYGTFATKAVMDYEDQLLGDVLENFLGKKNRGKLAIDVGCGDGRHSRPLAKRFDAVVAFDLSKAMIEAAKRKSQSMGKAQDVYRNIAYYTNDFEYEEFPEEEAFVGTVDFICASFGMPSFVEDTVAMLRRFHKWLRPRGQALLTFYNSESLTQRLKTPWASQSLSANLDLDRNALEVQLREDLAFPIFCRPLDEKVMEMVEGTFEIELIRSYPHMMSLMPSDFFGPEDSPKEFARDLFKRVDDVLAATDGFSFGHYIFIVVKKGAHCGEGGYLNVIKYLVERAVQYKVQPHRPVVSTKEAQAELGLAPGQMIKAVVFADGSGGYLAALLQGDQHVDLGLLAGASGVEAGSLVLASPSDVLRVCGFPIGGIAPFGLPAEVRVFVDQAVESIENEYVYMGVGDNTKTLRLGRTDFLHLIRDYEVVPISSDRRQPSGRRSRQQLRERERK